MPVPGGDERLGGKFMFYRLRDAILLGRPRLALRYTNPDVPWFQIDRIDEGKLLSGLPPSATVEFFTDKPTSGETIIWSSWPGPFIVHREVIDRFAAAGLTGWTTL